MKEALLEPEVININLIQDKSKENESDSINEEDIYAVFINNQEMNDRHERNKIDTSKYKLFNFFAKILIEQFSRLANVYFLIIAVLQSVKELSYSGGNPIILFPLSFVVILNGVKDMYEDFKRKKSDRKENHSECYIYNPLGGFQKKKWFEIKLGDIVKVYNNQQFPADLLLLSTSDENGICYVETKNLDGETNLKFRQANPSLHKLIHSKDENVLSNLNYVCITKPPNEFIYKFDATLYETNKDGNILDRKKFELFSNKSFLLRGCALRQTDYIIGVAIYVGPHTKSMINSPDLKTKHSSVEAEMNKQLIAIFCIQLIIAFILAIIYCIISSNGFFGLAKYYFSNKKHYKGGIIELLLKMAGTWVIICTNFVPISLLVTMESIKLFQGMFIEWDIDMYDKETVSGCKVQCSTLNEELGQVKYVFSDKTGTLTKNYMKYKMMSIGEKIYGSFESQNDNKENDSTQGINNDNENLIYNDDAINNNNNNKIKYELKDKYGNIPNVEFIDENNQFQQDRNNEDKKQLINEFMLCLSLCNSVLIDNKKKTDENIIDYQSSSPDEKAFVCFARSQGYILTNRALDDTITLEINGEEKYFKLLNTLDYSSERKRMSVIIKTTSNKYMVYTKGADSMIEQLLSPDEKSSNLLKSTNEFLKKFATKGLRTLMIGYKEISEDYYNKWDQKYKEVKSNANHTEADINKVYDEMENNFNLIGSTAIEDELQDNVGEIINYMMQTGMRVWMLTGDKLDTAKNIAISCKLFQENMKIFEIREHLSNEELYEELRAKLTDNELRNYDKNFGLLISSEEIEKIFSDKKLTKPFFDLCISCLTVVCSRVSPKQKGQLVNLIKTTEKAITLAVGDGANDVGMITEANVGIGIQGKEGTQAARASDYAIKDFACLKKLLFFHGRESYRKNSWVILYNFYKNVLFVAPMIWSGFITLFSGITTYDPVIHQFINMVYTSIPPVMFGVFNYEYSKEELMRNPRYYIQGIYYKCFHMKRFIKFFFMGFFEGLIIFILSHYWYCEGNSNGFTHDFYGVGTVILAGVVTIANLKVYLDMHFIDYFSLAVIILSVLSYYLSILIFSNDYIFSKSLIYTFLILDNFVNVIIDLKFLFCITLVCTFCYFLEIFAEQAPILYGFVVEGKFLQPYQKQRNNSSYYDFEVIDQKEELDTYYSTSMASQNKKKEEEEEEEILT
jgi:phospholipid-transporting ATPase